jgi:hypothetical protein
MPKKITIPLATYGTGSVPIASTLIPGSVTSVTVTLDVGVWTNPLARLTLRLEKSEDGGKTWTGGGVPFEDVGPNSAGVFLGKNGLPRTIIVGFFTWPSTVTHVRGTLQIAGGTIRTVGSVEIN